MMYLQQRLPPRLVSSLIRTSNTMKQRFSLLATQAAPIDEEDGLVTSPVIINGLRRKPLASTSTTAKKIKLQYANTALGLATRKAHLAKRDPRIMLTHLPCNTTVDDVEHIMVAYGKATKVEIVQDYSREASQAQEWLASQDHEVFEKEASSKTRKKADTATLDRADQLSSTALLYRNYGLDVALKLEERIGAITPQPWIGPKWSRTKSMETTQLTVPQLIMSLLNAEHEIMFLMRALQYIVKASTDDDHLQRCMDDIVHLTEELRMLVTEGRRRLATAKTKRKIDNDDASMPSFSEPLSLWSTNNNNTDDQNASSTHRQIPIDTARILPVAKVFRDLTVHGVTDRYVRLLNKGRSSSGIGQKDRGPLWERVLAEMMPRVSAIVECPDLCDGSKSIDDLMGETMLWNVSTGRIVQDVDWEEFKPRRSSLRPLNLEVSPIQKMTQVQVMSAQLAGQHDITNEVIKIFQNVDPEFGETFQLSSASTGLCEGKVLVEFPSHLCAMKYRDDKIMNDTNSAYMYWSLQ